MAGQALLLLLSAAAAVSAVYTNFVAQVTITDTNVYGSYGGQMTYFYNGASSKQSTTYTVGGGAVYVELLDFADSARFMKCSSTCQAEAYKNAVDRFFLDTSTDTLDGSQPAIGSCSHYRRSGSSITDVWADSNGVLCAASWGTTKKISFSGYSQQGAVTASDGAFSNAGWGCQAKVCNVIMDLVLIFDESSSISGSSWNSLTSFAKKLVSQFTISSAAVNVGLVCFSDNARIVGYLDGNVNNVNTYLSTRQQGGNTCIGCGLNAANTIFNAQSAYRKNLYPKKVSILFTDGQNNRGNLQSGATAIKNNGVISMAVGVGSSVSVSQLKVVASSDSYVTTVSNYASLQSIISNLVTATCSDYPSEPCGSSCRGFCACGQTCVCPNCPTSNACFASSCTLGQYFNGCQTTSTNCNDGNACTNDWCDNATGCSHSSVSCDDSDPCTDDYCDSNSGCYHTQHKCDDGLVCTDNLCSKANGGCYYPKITCNDGLSCTDDVCEDPTIGCTYTRRNCDDNDACTADSCSEPGGNCVHTNITCSPRNACELASCDPAIGCVYMTKSCKQDDPCFNYSCDNTLGCQQKQIPCDRCGKVKCPTGPCIVSHCEQNTDSAWCVNESVMADASTGCNHNDPCLHDTCNMTDGKCSYENMYTTCVAAEKSLCRIGFCNKATGACDSSPVICTPSDSCHVSNCDEATGKCIETPACEDFACMVTTCVNTSATEHNCSWAPKDCSTGSACRVPKCNTSNNECYWEPLDCTTGQYCNLGKCNDTIGCVNYTRDCEDGDPCTDNKCQNEQCVKTPHCQDTLFCTQDLCTSDGKCQHPAIVCNLNMTDTEKSCYKAACSEKAHCYKSVISGAFTNPCGSCVGKFSNDTSDTKCFGTLTWPKFAGALAGGVIAGIVIAAVVGFGIFASVSAFGTYKLIQMSKLAKGMAAHNNPMYRASDNEMTNPAYANQ